MVIDREGDGELFCYQTDVTYMYVYVKKKKLK